MTLFFPTHNHHPSRPLNPNPTPPMGSSNSSFDSLLLQSLMGRLQLRPPYLHTNSFLSNPLDDLLDLDLDLDFTSSPTDDDRSALAREESKLERDIIRLVHSPSALDALKPNSGQSVAVGDHHVCVAFHLDEQSGYRVWEWHGHVMLFDEDDGYSPEYVYGNYFERLQNVAKEEHREEDEEEDGGCGGNSGGLKDLIGDGKDVAGAGIGRVIHRNSLAK